MVLRSTETNMENHLGPNFDFLEYQSDRMICKIILWNNLVRKWLLDFLAGFTVFPLVASLFIVFIVIVLQALIAFCFQVTVLLCFHEFIMMNTLFRAIQYSYLRQNRIRQWSCMVAAVAVDSSWNREWPDDHIYTFVHFKPFPSSRLHYGKPQQYFNRLIIKPSAMLYSCTIFVKNGSLLGLFSSSFCMILILASINQF